jgi:hypothetical protein
MVAHSEAVVVVMVGISIITNIQMYVTQSRPSARMLAEVGKHDSDYRTCGSHSGGYEEFYLLGYNAM